MTSHTPVSVTERINHNRIVHLKDPTQMNNSFLETDIATHQSDRVLFTDDATAGRRKTV